MYYTRKSIKYDIYTDDINLWLNFITLNFYTKFFQVYVFFRKCQTASLAGRKNLIYANFLFFMFKLNIMDMRKQAAHIYLIWYFNALP